LDSQKPPRATFRRDVTGAGQWVSDDGAQDLTEEQRHVVERCFRGTLSQLNAEAEVRLGATLTLALNTFLLRYGLDVTSRLRALHHGITPFFRQAWRSSGKDAKMKVCALGSLGLGLGLKGHAQCSLG
jgi:hypothetical protein